MGLTIIFLNVFLNFSYNVVMYFICKSKIPFFEQFRVLKVISSQLTKDSLALVKRLLKLASFFEKSHSFDSRQLLNNISFSNIFRLVLWFSLLIENCRCSYNYLNFMAICNFSYCLRFWLVHGSLFDS
jgi:hypothetical protein